MPKTAAKSRDLVDKYLREFPNETFVSDANLLYCSCCEKVVSVSQRFQVTQHIATAKHKENKERKSRLKQTFITASSTDSTGSGKSTFNTDLCRALIRADIPIHKINNPDFKSFLEKYINKKMPDESTLRKTYLKDIYMETLNKIRDNIKTGTVWVSIDETTDVEGRYIANIIVGKLCSDTPSTPFLLNCEVLEKCNHATISRFFNDSMGLLWPNGVLHDKVLLFLSDAAPYMVKAGNALRVFYPKMIHLTCLAHAMHRVAETVRSMYPDVDLLISTVKKIFLKAPSRVAVLKQNYPELCLPPQPVITRWGTWLEAAQYYCDNFNEIKDVVSKLDPDSAKPIQIATYLMDKHGLKNDLAYISSNAVFLALTITKLEAQNISLVDSVFIVKDAIKKLEETKGENGNQIKKKMNDCLEKNPGWKDVKLIADIHAGNEVNGQFDVDLTPMDIASFKYAPITSVDVERSFSRYKIILRPDRRHFTFENLKYHVISNNFKC